ncbi:MAG: hypothetical protein RJA90_1523, partial [Bacteroidota bacterium]
MRRLTFFLLFVSASLYSQRLRHAEIVGRPTDKSIVIQAFFDEDAEVSIKYGKTSGTYSQQTPWSKFTKGDPAELLL